jgi:HAD superfamily hydrolase (TIGR01509 family)
VQNRRVPADIRAVVFDVGETLVDESRTWWRLAELAGVPPFTLMALLGALIERNEDHREVWRLLGVPRPPVTPPIDAEDLYPDALASLVAVRARGLLVGIAGNQPAGVEQQLRAAGCGPDFIASSAAWGVAKPSAEFFARVAAASGCPAHEVLYVGDRLDNDVLPAKAAGMRTAFLRRGPWGHVHAEREEVAQADLRLETLGDLVRALA